MASSGQGTLLQLKIAGVYTTIAKRTKIKPAARSRNKLETTDLDSAAEESIPGIPRAGELDLEVNLDLDQTTHVALYNSYANGTIEDWRLIHTNAGAAQKDFKGWISNIDEADAATDTIQKDTIKIQVTGPVDVTP